MNQRNTHATTVWGKKTRQTSLKCSQIKQLIQRKDFSSFTMVTTPLMGRRAWGWIGSFRDGTLNPLKSLWTLPPPRKGVVTRLQFREEGLDEAEGNEEAEAEALGAALPLIHDDLGDTERTRRASAGIVRGEDKATSMAYPLPFSLRRKMAPPPARWEDGEPRWWSNHGER